MKKSGFLLLLLFTVFACSKEETNLKLTGKVQGLKKGILYLQKIEDTSLITIDSVVVNGQENFTFETYIDEPQALYLYLNKVDNNQFDDRVMFFAEPGEMGLNTTLQNFEGDAIVEGSENQLKLMEYRQMMRRFNDKNLELIQKNLIAKQQNDLPTIDSTTAEYDNLLRKRYLFTVNFAINHKDYELAPYLAISEVHDANIKYLDTIYSSLTPKVKESKYGKSLQDYLEERRAEENKAAAADVSPQQ